MDNTFIDEILNDPYEDLHIEIKQWLDVSDPGHKAVIAKGVIALANHGGGNLIIGFCQQPDGSFLPDQNAPSSLDSWSSDAINGIVKKYVQPAVQCKVLHRPGPTGQKYPAIIVPGGHNVPVRAIVGSPDQRTLLSNKIYVRRTGPASEEPQTTEDWDSLLEKCLQNRKLELLDAMRSILSGSLPVVSSTIPKIDDALSEFKEDAIRRWEKRVSLLPDNASAKLPFGHMDIAFAIDGHIDQKSHQELLHIIQSEVRNHSGRPAFPVVRRQIYAPKQIDGALECWIGPDEQGRFTRPDHHEFWRISNQGLFFLRRGFAEDAGIYAIEPGTAFDITTNVWRLGEAVLQASLFGKALGASAANLVCDFTCSGLNGRRLVSYGNPNRPLIHTYVSGQASYHEIHAIELDAVSDELPEIVRKLIAPLYDLFDFFPLPDLLIAQELAQLRRNIFPV